MNTRREEGQALILIILVSVVLLGFAALAVDGGALYVTRRQAQNVADSAALSGAYAKCKGQDANTAALASVTQNGYSSNAETNIQVNIPPSVAPYNTDAGAVEVVITTTTKPFFSGFVTNQPLVETVRAVSHCKTGTGGGSSTSTGPALGGEVSILALNPSIAGAVTNTGAGNLTVDGGIYVNSNNSQAFLQNGSAQTFMDWAMVHGGADLGGAFGIYATGGGSVAKVITIQGNLRTSGAGSADTSGAFTVGGDVHNGASIHLVGNPFLVGGNYYQDGASRVDATTFNVVGSAADNAGSAIYAGDMTVGGDVNGSGGGSFNMTGATPMKIKGNTSLSGSVNINGNVIHSGTVSFSGTSRITGSNVSGSVTTPSVNATVPVMADPFLSILGAPTYPTGGCTTINLPSDIWEYGSWSNPYTVPLTSGGYYCLPDFGASWYYIIPPGTYWVDNFSLSGAAKLKMDGVTLLITGVGKGTGIPTSTEWASASPLSNTGALLNGLGMFTAPFSQPQGGPPSCQDAFSMGGSTEISLQGTMIYLKGGNFSISGASGTFNWTAPGSGNYNGLSLYMDRTNHCTVSQTGSTAVASQSGTWYAPSSLCSFTGATSTTLYSQFICDRVTVTGSSNLKIKYDGSKIFQTTTTSTGGTSTQVELLQ